MTLHYENKSNSLDSGSEHSTIAVNHAATKGKDWLSMSEHRGSYTKQPQQTRRTSSSSFSSSSSSSSNKRSVSFNPRVKVKYNPDPSYATVDESLIWYMATEVKFIRCQGKVTLEMMKGGRLPVDTDYHCRRGLECHLPANSTRKKAARVAARTVVMEEQDRQTWVLHETDADLLAELYSAQVLSSQMEAIRIADLDYQDVRRDSR